MTDPRSAWRVVEEFEAALCAYTGAPFCVATDSCTNALYLCFVRLHTPYSVPFVDLPKRTYVGVARAWLNAGGSLRWSDEEWIGEYMIADTIVDAARWLRRGMYQPETWTCLSFHATKHLPIGRGGAILCDHADDAEWFRRARYDGRDQVKPIMEQTEFQWGIHAYMPPEAASRGLLLMSGLKDYNDPLPGIYPDLSKVKFT
jgi:dTDP-4-amino-4,6-dideoxygalactose transaminase